MRYEPGFGGEALRTPPSEALHSSFGALDVARDGSAIASFYGPAARIRSPAVPGSALTLGVGAWWSGSRAGGCGEASLVRASAFE